MDEPDVTSWQAVAKVDGLRGTEELATEPGGRSTTGGERSRYAAQAEKTGRAANGAPKRNASWRERRVGAVVGARPNGEMAVAAGENANGS